MSGSASISLLVEPLPDDEFGALAITPMIDGRSFVDMVEEFELAQGFDAAGGYAGLVPSNFNFGDLTTYYLGAGEGQWPEPGQASLLGCDCGEVGCWPLDATITTTLETVTWSGFTQGHRPNRNYDGLGTFVFSRDSYDAAVRDACRQLP